MQHKTFFKKLKFNKLIIIDCLSDGDYQTGLRLHEYLNDTQCREYISYKKAENKNQFIYIMNDIIHTLQSNSEYYPIIHIEGHGSPVLMEFPDKGYILWKELSTYFRKINKCMGNQLISFIATCHGYNFIKENITLNDFSPAYYCVAPKEEIMAGDIEDATLEFYKNLFLTSDLTSSANSLNSSLFYSFDADRIFHKAIHEIFQNFHRGKPLKNRKEILITKCIKQYGQAWTGMTEDEQRNQIKIIRGTLNFGLKNEQCLRSYFDRYSKSFLGYSDASVFDEIWQHMQQNKQGSL